MRLPLVASSQSKREPYEQGEPYKMIEPHLACTRTDGEYPDPQLANCIPPFQRSGSDGNLLLFGYIKDRGRDKALSPFYQADIGHYAVLKLGVSDLSHHTTMLLIPLWDTIQAHRGHHIGDSYDY